MMFWVLAAVLTAVVTIALLLPLSRRKGETVAADHDVEVYSDQLAEVERDRAEGLIGDEEANYARGEIGRRLLRAERSGAADAAGRRSRGLVGASRIAVLISIPVIGMGTYLATGAPSLPDQPLAARAPENGPSAIASMIAQAERHLAENPDDGRGWDVLAPVYLRIGQLEAARNAYLNAIRLQGPSAARQSGYGETLVALAGGVVTEEARVAFQSARELQPSEPKSAFYLAMALAQEGREDRALDAFRRLAETSPPDAPWMEAVNAQIAALGGRVADLNASGLPPLALLPQAEEDRTVGRPEATPRGPSAEDIEAARDMSAADRQQMIEGMVESLDARLRDDPQDIEGWIRLVRSYGVLGRTSDASDALARGLEIFPEESDDRRALMAVARQVGLDGVAGEEGTP